MSSEGVGVCSYTKLCKPELCADERGTFRGKVCWSLEGRSVLLLPGCSQIYSTSGSKSSDVGIEYYVAAHLKVVENKDHTCTSYFTYNYIPRSFRVISRSRSLSEFVL